MNMVVEKRNENSKKESEPEVRIDERVRALATLDNANLQIDYKMSYPIFMGPLSCVRR